MFNEELENALLDRFTKRFSQYNEKVLIELGNVIKEIGELIPKDAYRLSQQLKYNTTIDELKKELANITGKSVKEIEIILEKIAKDNLEFASTYYKAKNLNVPIYEEHKELQKLVKSIVKASQETFVNIAKSTGFKLLDSNKKPIFLNIEETYHKVVDEAIYAITTGKSTYTEQMRSITKQLSDSGVRILEYESGYTRRLDSAVRMNMMDTIKKVSNETNALFGKEFGSDGVEITIELDPAPDHEDIQGHQFSDEEFEKFQNHINCHDYKGNFISHKKGKYERRKISEWNCRHRANPIVLGISNSFHSDKELQDIIDKNHKGVEIEGKHYTNYEARQLQRQIETEIRKNKETYITARGAGDEELMSKAEYKVRLLGKKYKSISKQGNLKADNERLYVPNYKNVKLNDTILKKGTCTNQNFVIGSDGHKYIVDNKNIKLDHSQDEINIGTWFAQTRNINIKMLPRVLNPPNIKTGDFIEEETGIVWEIKEPEGNTLGTTMLNQFKGQKEKAHKFIIDIHKSKFTPEEATKEIESILSNTRYDWVEEVILKNDNNVIKEFKK